MANSPPKDRSPGDWSYALAKAAMSAVPMIGSPAAELFGFLVIAPASKRKDEWVRSLAERLEALENKIPGLIDTLRSNDDFVTTALHATQVAIRSHQKEKLAALRNAVLNVAAGTAPAADPQLMFLMWVDVFTPAHLAFLQTCASARIDEQRATVLAQMSLHRQLSDSIVNDLNTRGLLIDPRPYAARNRESNSPLVSLSWRVSQLGQQFVAFIEEPRVD